MRIGITYNLKDEISPLSILDKEYNEEFDSVRTIDTICGVFEKNGLETVRLGGGIDIIDKIAKDRVDFVFNIAEGYYGRNRESSIPSILEMLDMPYSGSDPLTLGITLDKLIAKKIFGDAEIATPAYGVVKKVEDIKEIENRLQYPLITKPAWEGSSKGIYDSSRVFEKDALERNIKLLLEKFPKQPVLVEEYIKGREITVGVIGNEYPQVIGLMEIVNRGFSEDFFYSLEVKRDWKELVDYICPPDIPHSLEWRIKRYAITTFKEFGCRDIARMDFRISEYNEPFILEVNPLPGLSPEYGDLVIMAQKLGIGYEGLLISILNQAFLRYNIPVLKKDALGDKLGVFE